MSEPGTDKQQPTDDTPLLKILTPDATAEFAEVVFGDIARAAFGVGRPPHDVRQPARTDPQRYAEYAFARDLSDHLEKAANEHRFDRLILVAAPKALGDLRELLPKTVHGKIVAEIDKDLTNVPTRELGKHLDEHLRH